MQSYVTTVLTFAAITFLASLLFPSGNERTKKAFSLALSLLFLVILLRPLSALSDFSFSLEELKAGDLSDVIEEAEGETLREVALAVGAGIACDLEARFSLARGSVVATPTLAVVENELCITSLTLSLRSAAIDGIAIRDFARKNYTENCEVITDAR